MSASSLNVPAAGPAAADACGGTDADVFRQSFNLRVAAFFIIFVCSAAGVTLPVVLRMSAGVGNPMRGGWLFIAKAFGAGVILAVGLIHVMPDANNTLGDPCLGAQYARAAQLIQQCWLVFWRQVTQHVVWQRCLLFTGLSTTGMHIASRHCSCHYSSP